jgi:streptogramin lyase
MTTSGVVAQYPVPTAGSGPKGITVGPDGNLWFTESLANNVATVTTSGVVTEYAIPTASSSPSGIAAGPDGNLWFAETNGNKVAQVTTSGVVTEHSIPTASSNPTGIAAGPDGKVWFTEAIGKVAKIVPGRHSISQSTPIGPTVRGPVAQSAHTNPGPRLSSTRAAASMTKADVPTAATHSLAVSRSDGATPLIDEWIRLLLVLLMR